MAKEYRVIDCRTDVVDPSEFIVTADTAEQAAWLAIGEDLVRGTTRSGSPRARVYSQSAEGQTMIRLYAKSVTRKAERSRLDRERGGT